MKPYPKYLDWLRYLSAWLLFTYGISKLAGVQFTHAPDMAQRPVGSLSGYQLTWYYYSYSHVYGSILGLVQVAGGAMLLFRKTATLGAAMMLPVMTNILMVNLFFFIGWGAQFTSAFIFASMLALLWHDRTALAGLFWRDQNAEPTNSRRFHRSVAALIVLVVAGEMAFGFAQRGANAGAAHAEPGARERLIGTWKVVSAGTIRPDGKFEPFPEYGPNPIGYLMYDTTGHMCVSLANPNDPHWANPEKPTDAERLRSYDAFFAYCGTYEVREKESRVIHRPEMGSWPHYIGTDQSRNFRLEGDRLILSEEETPPGGERSRYQVTWERVKGSKP